MSIIESLMLNIDDIKNIKPSKTKGNFLLNLITYYKDEPEKLNDLFKNLDINEKNLDSLIKNTDKNKQTQKDILNLINKIKNLLKENTEKISNENISDIELEEQPQNILQKLINESMPNNKLEQLVTEITKNTKKHKSDQSTATVTNQNISNIMQTTQPEHLDKKIVKFTKQIINSKITLQNLKLSDKEIQTFKEIKTFKELVDFANKKELNISKIVLSYFKDKSKTTKNDIKFQFPKNKVELKQSNTVFKQHTLNKINIQNPVSKEKNEILTLLLQNSNKTEHSAIQNDDKYNFINNNKKNTQNTLDSQNTQINSNTFNIDTFKQNILKAKESIKHFANNLKEAVDNYKPPVSKLSMELHPKELGKVEVTIVHRGENLQIQINSNNTAIGFLHSTQQELRQNLINMGFTDVNMSFNQQQQGNKEYRQNQKFTRNDEENDELIIEIPYQYA